MEGQVSGLCMDIIAEDAGAVEAELRLSLISERETGGEERIVADFLNDGELRARDVGGEEFGARIKGNDGIG